MIDLKTASVTAIQFFDQAQSVQIGEDEYKEVKQYSANIVINDCVLVQLSGNDDEAHRAEIPHPNIQYWGDKQAQEWACENLDIDDVEAFLDREGIENNFYYLSEHGETI